MLFMNVASFMSLIVSHTWVEQISLLAPDDSSLSSPGYSRGNDEFQHDYIYISELTICLVPRTSDTFLQLGDKVMTYLLSPNKQPSNVILSADQICKLSQQLSTEAVESSKLQASAETQILLHYQKNDHITLSANTFNKLTVRMISIYDINQSCSDDTLQTIHNVWNVMNTEDDQQGQLLTQQNFDDEACYQSNDDCIWWEQCVKYSPDSLQS